MKCHFLVQYFMNEKRCKEAGKLCKQEMQLMKYFKEEDDVYYIRMIQWHMKLGKAVESDEVNNESKVHYHKVMELIAKAEDEEAKNYVKDTALIAKMKISEWW